MSTNKIIIDESGIFDQARINEILKDVKLRLSELPWNNCDERDDKINKRIYAATVECLDNVLKHSEDIAKEDDDDELYTNYPSRFYLEKTPRSIIIYAGNKILNKNIERLTKRFEVLKELKLANLNQLYKKKLLTAEISDRGGAGLGLIIIAKISGKKIKYDFEKINNKFSYFALQIEFNFI